MSIGSKLGGPEGVGCTSGSPWLLERVNRESILSAQPVRASRNFWNVPHSSKTAAATDLEVMRIILKNEDGEVETEDES